MLNIKLRLTENSGHHFSTEVALTISPHQENETELAEIFRLGRSLTGFLESNFKVKVFGLKF